eukprot:4473027-Prymnesium_polylepis.1
MSSTSRRTLPKCSALSSSIFPIHEASGKATTARRYHSSVLGATAAFPTQSSAWTSSSRSAKAACSRAKMAQCRAALPPWLQPRERRAPAEQPPTVPMTKRHTRPGSSAARAPTKSGLIHCRRSKPLGLLITPSAT